MVAKKTSEAEPGEGTDLPAADAKAAKGPPAGVLREATNSARVILGDGTEGVAVSERDGVVSFAVEGVTYANLRAEGFDLVAHLLEPTNIGVIAPDLELYARGPSKGWLEFRTSVARDSKPWLAADVGRLVGQTRYEIRTGKTKA